MWELLLEGAGLVGLGLLVILRTRPHDHPHDHPHEHPVPVARRKVAPTPAPAVGRQATFKRRRERWTDATNRPAKR